VTVELQGDLEKTDCALKFEKPFRVKYIIRNQGEDQIIECVSLIDDSSKSFYISGEIRSRFDIMPLDEVVLEYKFMPLTVGKLELPSLYLADRHQSQDAMDLTLKNLADPRWKFLAWKFTKTCFIEH